MNNPEIESHVLTVLIDAFWLTATQLVHLIVPLIVLWFLFKMIASLLLTDRA